MCGHTLTYLEVAIKINKPHDRFLITSIFENYKPRKPFLRVCQARFFPILWHMFYIKLLQIKLKVFVYLVKK